MRQARPEEGDGPVVARTGQVIGLRNHLGAACSQLSLFFQEIGRPLPSWTLLSPRLLAARPCRRTAGFGRANQETVVFGRMSDRLMAV